MTSHQGFEPVPLDLAPEIASHNLILSEAQHAVEVGQAKHRQNIINYFGIAPGSRVLEVGCGQGTCTTVLAHYVGEAGHVDAIDPARLDYGAPLTLGQAQAHLSEGKLGSRITFWNEQLEDFLARTAGDNNARWDYVIFVHSLWYFSDRDVLRRMFNALQGRARKVLIAEYAMTASEPASMPHVLAALARATLEAHDPASKANIRCLLSPSGIKLLASETGYVVERQSKIVPEEDLMDGRWEVGDVKSEAFLGEIEEKIRAERVKVMLRSSRDAVLGALENLRGEKARTMDVWMAVLSNTAD